MLDAWAECCIVNLDERIVTQNSWSSADECKYQNYAWIDYPVPDALLEELCSYIMDGKKTDLFINNSKLANKEKDDLCLDMALGAL